MDRGSFWTNAKVVMCPFLTSQIYSWKCDGSRISKVVLLYPDISNFTFGNVKNLKCKIFLIDFLDELGNFKQKKFYTSKCKIFLHFTTTDPIVCNRIFGESRK